MLLFNLVAAILAVATPSPSPSPHELKTIITVVSSPYCKSLAEHFNDAMTPMLANDRTLEEVGREFNVTRERIRQIEAKALRKLRHPSRSRKLKDYLE